MRSNRFNGVCATCKKDVPPGTGWIVPKRFGVSGFHTYCAQHRADAEAYATGGATTPEPERTEPVTLDADAIVARIAKLSSDFATRDVENMVNTAMQSIPTMVHEAFNKIAPRVLEVKVGKAPKVKIEQYHRLLPTILSALTSGAQVFLVGPAGSGKTTLAEQAAKALGRKFFFASRVTSEFKLLGFIDATGKCVRTAFREAYEHGGLFLFDEVDASDPDALTSFNAGLANEYCDFPDGAVKRHKDFVAMAAGNTFGRGADRQYVGRNQLDAATLDRFTFTVEVDYDEDLEMAIACNPDWTRWVQRVRRAVDAEKVRHIVSPRASIAGGKMLAAGMERADVENGTVWKGLPADQRSRVEARMLSV